MKLIKNFIVVVINLVAQLWTGIERKPEFYDQHTRTKTKRGYVLFVSVVTLATSGVIVWLYEKIY